MHKSTSIAADSHFWDVIKLSLPNVYRHLRTAGVLWTSNCFFFSIKKLFPFVLFILLEIKTTAYGKTIFVDSYILIKKITRQYFQRVRMTFMISMSIKNKNYFHYFTLDYINMIVLQNLRLPMRAWVFWLHKPTQKSKRQYSKWLSHFSPNMFSISNIKSYQLMKIFNSGKQE